MTTTKYETELTLSLFSLAAFGVVSLAFIHIQHFIAALTSLKQDRCLAGVTGYSLALYFSTLP